MYFLVLARPTDTSKHGYLLNEGACALKLFKYIKSKGLFLVLQQLIDV